MFLRQAVLPYDLETASCAGEARGCYTRPMCVRYTQLLTWPEIANLYRLTELKGRRRKIAPRYNIAPGQLALVVRRQADKRELAMLRWGLIPSSAYSARTARRTTNARAETVATTPAIRGAFSARRCLVPCSGFYEWQRVNRDNRPYWIGMKDRGPFAMAGLWEAWNDPATGEAIDTFCIVTTVANSLMAPIHDRMPVIIDPSYFDIWLEAASAPTRLLRPYPSDEMDAYPVGSWVNSLARDDPRCIEPLEPGVT